ncbi:MAG: glycosyltransferase family 4 protein [Micavibrio sp.]|nr:glycosyltransferase family 4 protein [Micavibrio sp.]
MKDKRKHIGFFSPVPNFKGGAEKSLFDLLSNPNIQSHIFVPELGAISSKAKELNINADVIDFRSIHNIKRPFTFIKGFKALKDLFCAALELKKNCNKNNIKIVHSNGLKAHAINCASYRFGGARAILHIRDIPYTKAEKLVWKILAALCVHMILVSRACWPYEKMPSNVSVIHNGTPILDDIEPKRTFEKNIKLGFSGRIHPAKGLHLLLEWMAQARKEGFNLTLSVRGSFSGDSPEYEREIYNLIDKLDLKNKIEFTGFINEPKKLYEDIDIIVVPSKTPDPLPRSVMEAMARGIIVFGYPTGGIPEMIINKRTGFLVKNGNEFIKALSIIEDKQLTASITQNAKELIRLKFSVASLHKEVTSIYDSVLKD